MSGLKSLQLAIDLATRKRDAARLARQQVVQSLGFAQTQLDQLQQYARETEQRWSLAAQVSTHAELLRHHYQFMRRLQYTTELQQGVLQDVSQKLTQAEQLLLQSEIRLASFKQLLARRSGKIAQLMRRREQKQMDEFAALQSQARVRLQMENAA